MSINSSTSITIPFPLKLRPFSPLEIYKNHVHGQRVIYLDNMFWIKLTDLKTRESFDCLEACRTARRQGKAIFPVSFASVGELLEQPPEAPRDRQARLMDELSDSITFRSPESIYSLEASAAYAFFCREEHGEARPLGGVHLCHRLLWRRRMLLPFW
jgi:hypothetical protein